MKDVAIHIQHVTKRYAGSKVDALSDVSLSVAPGQVYGFLGSNGAGKSTMIRAIMNFIAPTSGSIKIMGADSKKPATAHKSIGYVAGDVALPKNVTGRQLLGYMADLQGGIDKKYMRLLADKLSAQLDKKIGELSKGNRQKIGLLQAFMHQPQVLVLDEPTSGLDPLMQEVFYEMIADAKQRGAAVLLSSHNFAEVERVCDRVAIIRGGKLVADTSVAALRKARKPTWLVTVKDAAAAKQLAGSQALKIVGHTGATIMVQPAHSISAALTAIGKVDVAAFAQQDDELENEFMAFYKGGNA